MEKPFFSVHRQRCLAAHPHLFPRHPINAYDISVRRRPFIRLPACGARVAAAPASTSIRSSMLGLGMGGSQGVVRVVGMGGGRATATAAQAGSGASGADHLNTAAVPSAAVASSAASAVAVAVASFALPAFAASYGRAWQMLLATHRIPFNSRNEGSNCIG